MLPLTESVQAASARDIYIHSDGVRFLLYWGFFSRAFFGGFYSDRDAGCFGLGIIVEMFCKSLRVQV